MALRQGAIGISTIRVPAINLRDEDREASVVGSLHEVVENDRAERLALRRLVVGRTWRI